MNLIKTAALVSLLMLLASCSSVPTQKYSFSSSQMGVEFRIDLYAKNELTAKTAADKAFARIAELNRIMSDYLVDSELWGLSGSSGKGQPVKVSQDLWNVLRYSQKLHKQSQGAFDITAGPYFLLWRKARVIKRLPAERSMQRAANKVGMGKLVFDSATRSVELTAPKMRLDLGGVAKGYAADEALKVLLSEGVEYALVDGSGDISMTSQPINNGSWKVYISDGVSKASEYIEIQNKAVATSGDTYQFVEINGTRYSHIVNPKTGLGVTNRCRVTVIAPDGKVADALASTVTVLGPVKGIELIESMKGVEVLVQMMQNDKHQYFKSTGFPELIKK